MTTITINETRKGRLFVCTLCNGIHLEFGNVSLKFDQKEFIEFRKHLGNLDINNSNKKLYMNEKGKIVFVTSHPEIVLLFAREEVEEIKSLILDEYILEHISNIMLTRSYAGNQCYWNSLKETIKSN